MGHGIRFRQLSRLRRFSGSERRNNSVGSTKHRFESEYHLESVQPLTIKSAMQSGTAKQTVRVVGRDNVSAPDVSLRAMVDACVSNVAVLDESGSIIYASQAWDLLERNVTGTTGV